MGFASDYTAALKLSTPYGLPDGAVIRRLDRGDVLMREGEPSDKLCFVLWGRFNVYAGGRLVGEIGGGEPIGEIGFFADVPRTATVKAARASGVIEVDRPKFDHMVHDDTSVMPAIVRILAERLRRTTASGGLNGVARRRAMVPLPGQTHEMSARRTLVILPAGDCPLPEAFVQRLVASLPAGTTRVVQEADALKVAPEGADSPTLSLWLDQLERDHGIVAFVAAGDRGTWARRAISQADEVMLVAADEASPLLNPSEQLAFEYLPPSHRALVRLHRHRSDHVTGTAAWLEKRHAQIVHHVCLDGEQDLLRLRAHILGQATGFVAASGGGKGMAHLGLHRALEEFGATFDTYSGCSIGSAMAALFALGLESEAIDRAFGDLLVKSRVLERYTIPVHGLLNARRFDAVLKAQFGTIELQDVWKPCRIVATNLTSRNLEVFSQGPIWEAVRASTALPGVFPPFINREGNVIVDGAVADAVPLASLKDVKAGPNVVSMLTTSRLQSEVSYDDMPSPGKSLRNVMLKKNPWGFPSIVHVLAASSLYGCRPPKIDADMDLAISLESGASAGLIDFKRHTEIYRSSYEESLRCLAALAENGDPAYSAVLAASRR